MKIKTAAQLAQACRAAAAEKTLYVYGAFGNPMYPENQDRAMDAYAYNRGKGRQGKIRSATADTFGFDCSGLIKGVLWGWCGDADARYGGAVYASNGVPDQNADTMISRCTEVSEDFSALQVGEAVWMPGHIGVYIGDGLVVEASPKWADGVQITACNSSKAGYHKRTWKKHGKLPYVTYEAPCCVSLQVLSRGMQGGQVRALQRMLLAMGYALGSKNPIDGNFGPKTEAAVGAFQQEKGLPNTGCVDEVTWKALLEV